MTIVALILRTLGLPLCILLGMLGFYEGVPFIRDIPYIGVIPIVGELATGRVATESAKAATEARKGYVELSEKTAAEAKAAKIESDRKAGQIVIDAYQVQLQNLRAVEAVNNETHEQEIADYEKKLSAAGRRCNLDAADREWLLKP